MNENLCVRCGRPMADTAYVCTQDAHSLADALTAAAGHAEDAEAVIARQARYGAAGRGGSGGRLPVDLTASTRLALIGNTVSGWMRILLEETDAPTPRRWRPTAGPLCPPLRPGHEPPGPGYRCTHRSCEAIRDRTPPSPLAEACTWLAGAAGWLRKHPAADEAFRDLHAACDDLARLVDRPPDRDLVGMCDCGRVLYAAHGRTAIQCPERRCQLVWHVERSREILRRALDERLFTAAEAARLAVHLDGGDRSTEQVRKLINAWSARSLIVAHGLIEGEPTFRFGDIAARLARTPRRNREGAAA